MTRLSFLLVFLFLCVAPPFAPVFGQSAANPFELHYRLSTIAVGSATADGSAELINPFDVVPHRAPGAAKSLSENETVAIRPFSVVPRGGGLPTTVLFWMLVGMVGFLAFSVAANRSVVSRAWRGFLNDNALSLIQRESTGLVGSTPYYLLYVSFVINAGVFIFLVTRFFRKETFNNLPFLLLCIGLSASIFLSKQ